MHAVSSKDENLSVVELLLDAGAFIDTITV